MEPENNKNNFKPVFLEPEKVIQKIPEKKVEIILQEQNEINHNLLIQLVNQGSIITVLLLKICEELKIDLSKFMEELKKNQQQN